LVGLTALNTIGLVSPAPALLGNGASQYQTIVTGATPFAPVYSGFLLDGTTGGKTNLLVDNGTILNLVAGTGLGTGVHNTGFGDGTLDSNTTGSKNVFMGYQSGMANTEGYQNAGLGWQALNSNTKGYNNVGVGVAALWANTEGFNNLALGKSALHNNLIGYSNVAIGADSQLLAEAANYNVSIGDGTMSLGIVIGTSNVGIGYGALNALVGGSNNVALGYEALYILQSGGNNLALGANAMRQANGGSSNIGIGSGALYSVASGSRNVAIGVNALSINADNDGNIGIGYMAGAYENNGNFFYINNQDRTNLAGDRAGSLIWGKFDVTPASQILQINACIGIGKTPTAIRMDNVGSYNSDTGVYGGAARVTVVDLNTYYPMPNTVQSGILHIHDDTSSGSAIALYDANNGNKLLYSNITGLTADADIAVDPANGYNAKIRLTSGATNRVLQWTILS
jgi:hypothetical protein